MIDTNRILALAETVECDQDSNGSTAFGVATVANQVFEELGLDVSFKPQYMYNESRNGKIDGVKHAAGEKVRFTDEQVELYVAKLVAKHTGSGKAETEMPPAEV